MMNTRHQEKEVLVEYMEMFEQEQSIAKISIGENSLDGFVETTKEFKKPNEVDDAVEIIKIKKNAFEAWSTMVFMRGSYNRKYEELIHNLSIKHVIENDQYPKTLHEAVDVMRKVKFKL